MRGRTGNNNAVALNTINEACAALLEGTSTTGNAVGLNAESNVTNQVLAGDTCTSPDAPFVREAVAAKSETASRAMPFL
jgi:hypothetical protein